MKAENESGFFVPPHSIESSEGITGMSEIYVSKSGFFRICIARHLGRKVIIKSLKPDCSSDRLALQQFNKEFSIAFPIESRYVSRVLASITLPDGTPAIEMEFCQGDTLRSLFDSAYSFTAAEASNIVGSLLHGLDNIHRMGVVHRDIKPSNLIFDRDSLTLKIIDFGCAHSYDYISLRGPAGTIHYTPPEKRRGSPDPVPADDLYAAGMVILELAGHCPDRKISRRLESFGKALSSRRFATAAEALHFFNSVNPRKSYLLPAGVLAILVSAVAFILLSPRTVTEAVTADGDEHEENVINSDSIKIETGVSLDNTRTLPASGQPASASGSPAGSAETMPASDDTQSTAMASDRELQLMAIQAGPMVLRRKDSYPSADVRDAALAITSADSIYAHHVYEEFPKGSLADETLSKAVDSIYTSERSGLENKYLRRNATPYDRHRLMIIFKARLEYMLKNHMHP